jgi:hypothetical protein
MANTIDPTITRPNRSARRCRRHRANTRTAPTEHDHIIHNGTCPMGHPTFGCRVCNAGAGPGQCQSDLGCNNGIRCTNDCHW